MKTNILKQLTYAGIASFALSHDAMGMDNDRLFGETVSSQVQRVAVGEPSPDRPQSNQKPLQAKGLFSKNYPKEETDRYIEAEKLNNKELFEKKEHYKGHVRVLLNHVDEQKQKIDSLREQVAYLNGCLSTGAARSDAEDPAEQASAPGLTASALARLPAGPSAIKKGTSSKGLALRFKDLNLNDDDLV